MQGISAAQELHRVDGLVQALGEDYAHLGYPELRKTYLLCFELDVPKIVHVYALEDKGSLSNA